MLVSGTVALWVIVCFFFLLFCMFQIFNKEIFYDEYSMPFILLCYRTGGFPLRNFWTVSLYKNMSLIHLTQYQKIQTETKATRILLPKYHHPALLTVINFNQKSNRLSSRR